MHTEPTVTYRPRQGVRGSQDRPESRRHRYRMGWYGQVDMGLGSESVGQGRVVQGMRRSVGMGRFDMTVTARKGLSWDERGSDAE